ncbi:TetR/AcrR family transcriptional regulator [Priestia aryabhattai]|uniref:TetR/AcrR family transcriptional regulator n=1 Tax=Priestia aryabhattai TaxID=412384 RepID=UPI00210C9EC0|nr:TetR/AcrR family transcriptional regulator [Priestia aryabhattai]
MPKVREGYAEKKKQEILEAAKRVCKSKPVHDVAMRDIVLEAGMSQGGVYKYFSNLDEVFVGLLNQESVSYKVKDKIEALLQTKKDSFEMLHDFIMYIGEHIQESMTAGGEIYFELVALYSKDPQRFMKIEDQLVEVSNLKYIQKKLHDFITEQIEVKNFSPAVPTADLLAFMATAINGITQNPAPVYNVDEQKQVAEEANVEHHINTLSVAVRKLLGE